MPRRSILSTLERDSFFTLPESRDELIRLYTFNETDLSIIKQHRGSANRLGFAIQLCYMRYPGVMLGANDTPHPQILSFVAEQLKISPETWNDYGKRENTKWEHIAELKEIFGFKPFTMQHYRLHFQNIENLARSTDKAILLATELVTNLRHQNILLPSPNVIERICAQALTQANRHIFLALTESLTEEHHQHLDDLLQIKTNSKITWLAWLRQSPAKANSVHMNAHIERLKIFQTLDLPPGIERQIHQNRLLKIAREGGQMTPADLAKFEPQRRYATLVALVIEGMATVTDEIIDLHDRIMGKLFAAAKNKHQQQFQASGKAINDKVRLYGRIGRALLDAKQNGSDPFGAIESVLPWDDFAASVNEAQILAQPEDFDFLYRITENYGTLRRYSPAFLDVLKLRAASAGKDVMEAIDVLRDMNNNNTRKIPANAPTKFRYFVAESPHESF